MNGIILYFKKLFNFKNKNIQKEDGLTRDDLEKLFNDFPYLKDKCILIGDKDTLKIFKKLKKKINLNIKARE